MPDFVVLGDHIAVHKGKPPLLIGDIGHHAEPYLNPEFLRGRARPELAKARPDCVRATDADTILLWDGSNAGEFFRGKSGLVASTMAKLMPSSAFLASYFFHVAKHAERHLRSQTSGTGIPHVDRGLLNAIKVFCPPAEEQKHISEILDTCDAVIQKTETLIDNLKAIKKGLLHDLLTRGINASGQLRPPQTEAPHLYKRSPLGWIPQEWQAKRFEELAEYTNGNTFDAGAWTSTGLPIIRIQNLNGSSEFNYYAGTVNERWHVLPGDLLFAWAGQRGVSFGARFWDGPEGVLNQHIFKVEPQSGLVSKSFLHRLLQFRQPAIEDTAHGFKDSFLHVTKTELAQVVAGLPALDEQSAIEERIAVFEDTVRVEDDNLRKLRSLKSALMDDLLTGRVRVTPLLKPTPA